MPEIAAVDDERLSEPVSRVIKLMRDHYDEPLPLPELAATALLSQFHFARTFRRETGVSPGRYLAAIRLFEAKRLLLTTSDTVADISCRVGYSSVGTFTTRFTKSVGLPPNRYRQLPEGAILAVDPHFHRLPDVATHLPSLSCRLGGSITGQFELPENAAVEHTLIGVFAGAIPQSHPVACLLLEGQPPTWRIDGVPAGRWQVMALATQGGPDRQPLLIGTTGAVDVTAGGVSEVSARLREPRPTDPPILLSLKGPPAAA